MTSRLSRPLHPVAWWVWAIGLATAASRTTNLLLLALILTVAVTVVVVRRQPAPWALGLRVYLLLGLVVVAVRLVFRILLGADVGPTVLFSLPQLQLPDLAAGIRLGGPVSAEGLVDGLADGVRLATLLICVGAANLLADPKRLLTHLPAALHEVGATVVVALTVAPQLVMSVQRVRRARRLRGSATKGLRSIRATLMPVLEDALDRSMALAAAMDSRGYGRSAHLPVRQRRTVGGLLLLGVAGLCIGVYGLLDGTTPDALGLPVAAAGTVLAAVGMGLAGRGSTRTTYRPDPWRWPEWAVAMAGVTVATTTLVAGRLDPQVLFPPSQPLAWPELPLLAAVGCLAALSAVWTAPPVPRVTPVPVRDDGRPAAARPSVSGPVRDDGRPGAAGPSVSGHVREDVPAEVPR